MRIKTFTKGGYITGGFTSPGGTVTGKVILSGDPTEELQAATKGYTDSNLNNFNATSISTGTLQVGRLPAFTGDVTSSVGTNVLNLGTSGVSSGSYSKVTVNAKGLVTNGFGLSESDIPDLSWNKITSDKPTTLAGYGITDAFKVSGGALTGALTLHADPTNALHAATKQYTDSKVSGSDGVKVGDIIKKTTSVTPAGFLKCNGGEVVKADYSALYAVVGDVNSFLLQPGNGEPWRQQYEINKEQSSDITGWVRLNKMPTYRQQSHVVVTKNRVYMLGGYNNNGTMDGFSAYATINSDGSIGTWTNFSLSFTAGYSNVLVTKNKIHLIGGALNNTQGGDTYTADIYSDGSIGNFVAGNKLPDGVVGKSFITKNYVHTVSNTHIYSAPIVGDGEIGIWTANYNTLPKNIGNKPRIAITKNKVHIVGGSTTGYETNCITGIINSDGSITNWSNSSSLPIRVEGGEAFVTKNRVYLFGGYQYDQDNNSYQSNIVYTSSVNADGTLGAWTTGTSLPVGYEQNSQIAAVKGKIYLFSMESGNYVYSADISGGLNDYSPYYDGSLTPTDPTKFRLPDLTAQALEGSYYYIKA